jgi:ribonuclease T2
MNPCNERADGSSWVLHGLWPNRFDGSFPQHCEGKKCDPDRRTCGAEFVSSQITDLVPQLEKWWPDIVDNEDPGHADFWWHEYWKHGTCATSRYIKNMHDYFAESLKLQQKLDLPAILENAGITPGETYIASDIIGAIQAVTGALPSLTCKNDEVLHEVRICYDKNLAYTNCWPEYRKPCSRAILYPMPID